MNDKTQDLKMAGCRFGNLNRSIIFLLSVFACAFTVHAEDAIWKDITAFVSKGHSVISSTCNRVVDEGKDLVKHELKQNAPCIYRRVAMKNGVEQESGCASGIPRKVVVLVRGYGTDDAEYWGTMRIYLQENEDCFDVWDATDALDGSKSVLDNAKRLQSYIANKVGSISPQTAVPQRLSILAHSMGGQITRAYLGLGRPLIPVDSVIMLSPALCGSWLADFSICFQIKIPFGPNYTWQSTQDLSIRNALLFNAAHPFLPWKSYGTKYYTVAGNWHGRSLVDKVIELIIYRNHLDNNAISEVELVNDGVITQLSSWGEAGRAETRYAFGPDANPHAYSVIGFDGKFVTWDDHLGIRKNEGLYNTRIKPLLKASPLQEGQCVLNKLDTTTRESMETDSLLSPHVIVDALGGTISGGTPVHLKIPIDSTSEATFSLFSSTGLVSFVLQSPDGTSITPASTNGNNNIHYETYANSCCYSVSNPATGQWAMTISCEGDSTNTVDYSALVWERSSLTFAVSCNTVFVRTNDQLTIVGTLNKASIGVAGATVGGCVYAPDGSTNTVTLTDDGLHGDGGAGDGVYGVQFSATQQVGIYGINLKATGTETTGEAFEREGLGQVTFTAFSPIAELMDVYADYGIDLAPTNGLIDDFIIEVGVRVKEAGAFTVSGVLTGTNGVGITSATAEVTATEAGTQTVLLRFDAPTIYDSGALGGFDLTDLSLFGTSNNCALLDARTHAYATAGYDYFQFERADKDGDGLSDLTEEKIGTDPELVDSDFDNMPDKWESDNRLDPLVDDTTLDADQDGMSNFEELLAGTNPQDKASNLSIIDITGRIESEDDGYLSIAFRSVPQRKYAVLRAEALSGPWVQVGEPFVALSAESRVSFQKVPTQRCAFYRIALADEF